MSPSQQVSRLHHSSLLRISLELDPEDGVLAEVDRASFLGGRDHSGPGLEDQGALSDNNTLARLLGGSG